MSRETDLFIIGAGPFGLAMAAYAGHHNIDHMIVGKPMDFWRANMPKGMILRSGCDWHLDPLAIHTIEKYLATMNLSPADVEPLSLTFYLGYARWFREQKRIEPLPASVEHLDMSKSDEFEARLSTGATIRAKNVLLALGFRYFRNIPAELARMIPAERFSHTCDFVDFEPLAGKRCLIIGGRQSAFEWAALLHEAGAAAIHVSHRHETPSFMKSDWSWVDASVERMVEDPGWFRSLMAEEKEEINRRFWAEGRLKLEPWLWPRIDKEAVKIWPESRVIDCRELASRELEVRLDVGERLLVDHVVLATGYKVDMTNVPFLAKGTLTERMELDNGFPVLDARFQSSIPGLFVTSMPATRDFGPFFAFTVSVNASAKIIGSAITGRLESR